MAEIAAGLVVILSLIYLFRYIEVYLYSGEG